MGLEPLEFSECLTDSPFFREKLHAHEKELARTSKAIKGLISQCKDLLQAANSNSISCCFLFTLRKTITLICLVYVKYC